MKMKKAQEILDRYLKKEATKEEKRLIESWYNKEARESADWVEKIDFEKIGNNLYRKLPHNRSRKIRLTTLSIAASILLIIGFTAVIHFMQPDPVEKHLAYDIAPGKYGATLKLADGKSIQLDEVQEGTLLSNEEINISKTDSNLVVFNNLSKTTTVAIRMNILETQKAQEYQILLADGTKVWLNSETILKFPESFEGSPNRSVELIGEAYFEVSENKLQPFVVACEGQTIEVLGTHFNVESYNDQPVVKTTLLQGSVKVTSQNGDEILLEPGQQSDLNQQKLVLVVNPDIEASVAWKNGYFKFNESIERIMGKISRWYDVDILFDADFDKTMVFGGKISRSKNISSVLEIMQLTGRVNFEINNREITVRN